MSFPMFPILGGALIGASALLLMWSIGRIAGISGIVWGSVSGLSGDRLWRWMFLAGMVLGTFTFHQVSGIAYPEVNQKFPLAMLAGLIVGVGVKLGNGCTSGHGVCGMGRLSIRSIAATVVFMLVAIVTVALIDFAVVGVGE